MKSLQANNQFLTFSVGGEEYCVDILKIQEIRRYEQPNSIPNAPDFIRGMINLRGLIVPIVDLRVKLGCDTAIKQNTVTIVIREDQRTFGVVVDSVSDVIGLKETDIKPAPDFGNKIDGCYIEGIATIDSRMLIVLELGDLIGSYL